MWAPGRSACTLRNTHRETLPFELKQGKQILVFLGFWDIVFCIPCWPWICYVTIDGLELLTILLLHCGLWDSGVLHYTLLLKFKWSKFFFIRSCSFTFKEGTFLFFISFYMCVWVPVCMCSWCLQRSEEGGHQIPWNWSTGDWDVPWGVLWEQYVLLAMEPSLQSSSFYLQKYFVF